MELGNAQRKEGSYRGVAMTMIDSLSTLAVLGNKTEFARAVRCVTCFRAHCRSVLMRAVAALTQSRSWVSKHISFDLDVRVNVFEANIRLLGGLLSAHALALDKSFVALNHASVFDTKLPCVIPGWL